MAAYVANNIIIRRVGSTVRNPAIFLKSRRTGSLQQQKIPPMWSTSKAVWIAGTSRFEFTVPPITKVDLDQQMVELES